MDSDIDGNSDNDYIGDTGVFEDDDWDTPLFPDPMADLTAPPSRPWYFYNEWPSYHLFYSQHRPDFSTDNPCTLESSPVASYLKKPPEDEITNPVWFDRGFNWSIYFVSLSWCDPQEGLKVGTNTVS